MTNQLPEAMEAEFNQVARWTADVLEGLPSTDAIAAACRGSGNPAAISWLAQHMGIGPHSQVLDVGGGVGGPAAWLRQHYGTAAVIAEPMPEAALSAHRLWGLAATVAWADHLPFRDGSFDAGWALGVLDTTPAKQELLRELRRVVRPTGRLGLLAYLRATDELAQSDVPEGNTFSDAAELVALLGATGWAVTAHQPASELPGPPPSWQQRADEVKEQVAADHSGDPALVEVADQERQMGALLEANRIVARLYVATPVAPQPS